LTILRRRIAENFRVDSRGLVSHPYPDSFLEPHEIALLMSLLGLDGRRSSWRSPG